MKSIIFIAFFASLTAVSGFLRIPAFPVPFTLQSMVVFLSGNLLGSKKAALSQMIFLMIGLSGLPVFTSGGGLGYVLQPTFGYLLGFPLAAWVIGKLCEKHSGAMQFYRLCAFNGIGMLLIHTLGVVYLYNCMKFLLGKKVTVSQVLIGGSLIFLPAEILKISCAAGLAIKLKRIFHVVAVIALIFLFFPHASLAQNQNGLSKIRKEIQELENELKAKKAKETTLLEQVENNDREIGLRQRLLRELEKERKKVELAIHEEEIKLTSAIDSRKRQKELVLNRIRIIYKKGRMAQWEALVSMNSINQAMVWIKYQKKIMENDRRNFHLLQEKELQVEIQKRALEGQLDQKQLLIREASNEKKKYEDDKKARKNLLLQVNKEKETIQERLQEKRLAFRKIESLIALEENRRKEEEKDKRMQEKTLPPPMNTVGAKPIWPIRGRVISKYGRQQDPSTRTETENLGIDIEAQQGDQVQAVMGGQVKYVTWLRGMGNLVLLDHGGLYTVYGHLDAVFVNGGQAVVQGKAIGQVGDKTSLYGPVLHFEVWRGTTHYDPLIWLR